MPMDRSESAARRCLLDAIDRTADSGEHQDAVIRAAADGLREVTALDQVFIILREEGEANRATLRLRYAGLGAWERAQIRDAMNVELVGMRVGPGDAGLLDSLVRRGQCIELKSVAAVAGLARAIAPRDRIGNLAADAIQSQGIGYACAVPIASDGGALGVLIASSYGASGLSDEDLALVEAVAARLAAALSRP